MTDPDFSPVTGNRIRPINDCLCSTCIALRSGEPDTTPKEKPPMTDAKPRLFTIHLVDRGPTPDAPPDPTPSISRLVDDEVERRLSGLMRQLNDANIARRRTETNLAQSGESLRLSRRELSEVDRKLRDTNADRDRAIAERDAARAERRACEAECELLRKENCDLRDDVAGSIVERDKARALVDDWRGRADRLESALNEALSERDEARHERDRMGHALDDALNRRDEARKALADEKARGPAIGIAGCNLKAGSHVVWMDSAELAALRARVAESEAELAKTEKQRDENHASAHEWRSFFDTAIEERDAARIEVITAKNKLTDARAALDRLI